MFTYYLTVRDWASEEEIKQASGVDIFQLSKEVSNAQRIAAQKLIGVCPKALPQEKAFLVELSQRVV